MQLQALRKTVPPQLQDQVLASNRPLRILADALEAQSRSNAGGGAGSKAEERGEGDRPTQIPARLENLATGIMPRLGNLVGLGLEKEAGVGVGGADRGPRTAPAENQGGFAALHKQGFPENNRLRGESSEYIGLGAAEGRLSQSTERAANTVGRPKLVGRPLSLAEGGNKVLPTVTLHGSLGKIDSLRNEELFAKAALVVRGAIKPDTGAGSINTASLVREAEKILAGGISDTSSEKNSGWGLAETDMGATIRSQGLPSLR